MGANVSTARAARSNQISGTIYSLDDTYGAASGTTSKVAHANLTARTTLVSPNATSSTSDTVPTAPSSAAGKGWRVLASEPMANSVTPPRTGLDDRVTFDNGNWVVRARYRRIDGTLPSDVTGVTITAILYRVDSSGVSQQEIGRATSGSLTFTATVTTVSLTIAPGATVTFQAGDLVQLEIYITYPSAVDASGQNLAIVLNETSAAATDVAMPTFTYNAQRTPTGIIKGVASILKKVKLPYSARLAGVATVTKKIKLPYSSRMAGVGTIFKKVKLPYSARMVGVGALVKKFKTTFSARLAGVGTVLKKVKLPYLSRMVGVAALIKKIKLIYSARLAGVGTVLKKVKLPYLSRMVGVASMPRKLTLFRVFNARLAGAAVLSRVLTIRRVLASRMAGVASITKKLKLLYNAVMLGVSSVLKKVKLPYAARLSGVTTAGKKITKTLLARMVGSAVMNRALTIRRVLSTAMRGIGSALAGLPFSKIPGAGGAGTVVKKIFQIFDD